MKLLYPHWFYAFCVSSFATAGTCREYDVDILLYAKAKLFKLHTSVAVGDESPDHAHVPYVYSMLSNFAETHKTC